MAYIKRTLKERITAALEALSEGEHKPTHIMYKSNLSWAPFMKLIKMMLNSELITATTVGGHDEYYITDKGKQYLKLAKKLEEMLRG